MASNSSCDPGSVDEGGRREGVVLLAKGGYGEWPRRELENMLSALRAGGRYVSVEGAFIDHGEPRDGGLPHLAVALRACLDAGAGRIVIVPGFVPVDRTMREWLPKVIRRWTKKERVGSEVEIVLARALGDHPATAAAVAAIAEDAGALPDVRRDAPRDREDAWNDVPPHTYHALLCSGPRCTTLGAADVWAAFSRRLRERGLLETEGGAIPVRTGCLIPCNLGPMMVIHPGGYWYGAVNERAAERIVDEHIACGRPVEAHLRPRPRPGRRAGGGGAGEARA